MTKDQVIQKKERNVAGCRCFQCRRFCIAREVVYSNDNPAITSWCVGKRTVEIYADAVERTSPLFEL